MNNRLSFSDSYKKDFDIIVGLPPTCKGKSRLGAKNQLQEIQN